MDSTFTETQSRMLQAVFELGVDHASMALSQWLGRPMRLSISGVEEVELAEAVKVLGPEDTLVAACSMDLSGRLGGELLLVFEDRSGLALTDFLLGNPSGAATEWGELERSAALETANIVGCAFLNSLGTHLPALAGSTPLVPSPPEFRREFAGSLLEFALMDQAMLSDRVLMVRSRFTSDAGELNWWLVFVPRGETMKELSALLEPGGHS